MNEPSTSNGVRCNNRNDKLCNAILNILDLYPIDPSEYKELFFTNFPVQTKPPAEHPENAQASAKKPKCPKVTNEHIETHRQQHYLMNQCKMYTAFLQGLGLVEIAENIMLPIIEQFYGVHNGPPIEFQCNEKHCKCFTNNIKSAVSFLEEILQSQVNPMFG